MKNFVVVAGNIGAGKSTLVKRLSDCLGWKPYYEPVSQNPYLKDFYADMSAWAYKCQMFFLSDRLAMHRDLQEFSGSVVQDRSVYEDASIFARNLHLGGYIDDRDFETYWKLYGLIADLLSPPDVIVYLKASVHTLRKRIAERNREFEADIPRRYLEQLNSLYEDWIGEWQRCPVITVDVNAVDLYEKTVFDELIVDVRRHLSGHQQELF
jgi:deoxyadenosine/deoxycytidine kinase